jgi:hypothetical protein
VAHQDILLGILPWKGDLSKAKEQTTGANDLSLMIST